MKFSLAFGDPLKFLENGVIVIYNVLIYAYKIKIATGFS
jgi:hypothetical protein